uniref:Uncharacterized protein n=1 Tax=Micromonas pusilla TaxID=38833 RepID=A0A7S0IAB8_MICPS
MTKGEWVSNWFEVRGARGGKERAPPAFYLKVTPQPWKKTQTLTLNRGDGRANCGTATGPTRCGGGLNRAHDAETSRRHRVTSSIDPLAVARALRRRFPRARRRWEKPGEGDAPRRR